jgi:arsenical pump membrane protein
MALPWIAALGVEWSVLSRSFHPPRADEAPVSAPREAPVRWPRAGLAPVWIAVAGAVAITLPALLRGGAPPAAVVRSADPASCSSCWHSA